MYVQCEASAAKWPRAVEGRPFRNQFQGLLTDRAGCEFRSSGSPSDGPNDISPIPRAVALTQGRLIIRAKLRHHDIILAVEEQITPAGGLDVGLSVRSEIDREFSGRLKSHDILP